MAIKFNNPFKKKEQLQNEGASSNEVHIVICKLMNDRTPVEVAEFSGLQIKDSNFNLRLENQKTDFKEELNRKKHYLIEMLKYKIELTDETKEEKLEKIENKIKEIENSLTSIKDGKLKIQEEGKEVIKKVNKKDLEIDLRHYKVLKYMVQNDGDGSYEIINNKGQREIRFLSHDGILDPYFYRSNSDNGQPLTLYPDIGLSRKYYKEIDERVEQRFLKNQNDNPFAGIKGILIILAAVALITVGIIFNIRTFDKANELDVKLMACQDQNTKLANQAGNYYIGLLREEVINRSIDVSDLMNKDDSKKETNTLVDLSNKLTGK